MFAAVQCVGFALGIGLWCGSAELGGEGLEGGPGGIKRRQDSVLCSAEGE